MADTTPTLPADMKVYDDLVQGSYVEHVAQNLNALNGASNGAIQLQNESLVGYYAKESFMDLGGDVEERDPTDNDAVTDVKFTQDETISVKIFRSYRRAFTLTAFRILGKTPEEASMAYGQQLAEKALKDKVNTGIAAAAAALSQHTTGGPTGTGVVLDTTTNTVTHPYINQAMSLLGDASNKVVAFAMTGYTYHKLIGSTFGTTTIYSGTGVQIMAGSGPGSFGRPIIVTDAPALTIAGTPTDTVILGLTQGAVQIKEPGAPTTVSDMVTGRKNLTVRLQSEWDYNLGIKGHKWDTGNGGSAPVAASIALNTNWDLVAASLKDGPGVYLRCQQ